MNFCAPCGFQSDNEAVFKIHLQYAHKKNDIKQECIEILSEKTKQDLDNQKTKMCPQNPKQQLRETKSVQFMQSDQMKSFEKGQKVLKDNILASSDTSCPVCNESFRYEFDLKSHVEFVHGKKKLYKCYICFASFAGKCDLQRHISTVHQEKKSLECRFCKLMFSQKGSLNRHITSFHERKKYYICNICNKKLTQKQDLKIHIESIHKEQRTDWVCNVCSKEYSNENELISHKKRHKLNSPLICDYCNQRYTNQQSYEVHIRTHTGSKISLLLLFWTPSPPFC